MKNWWIPTLAAVAMAGSGLAAAVAAEQAKYPITAEATATLDKAIADMKQAEARRNVWTIVDLALDEAKRAAVKGDSAAVIKHATAVSDNARLSIEQADYPTVQ